jgi:hypothetical protein
MPNIEVHGVSCIDNRKQLVSKIARHLLVATPLIDGVVITSYDNTVIDVFGAEQPFLRVLCTDDEEAGRVIGLLKPLGMDIEWLSIRQFFPKPN